MFKRAQHDIFIDLPTFMRAKDILLDAVNPQGMLALFKAQKSCLNEVMILAKIQEVTTEGQDSHFASIFSGSKVKKKARGKVNVEKELIDEDMMKHGGWWHVKDTIDLKPGVLAIESSPYTYLAALDSGFFTIGGPHQSVTDRKRQNMLILFNQLVQGIHRGKEMIREGPDPEEILTVIKPPDAEWIALKTGYGKYVGVDRSGCLIAIAEAISAREKWEVVFDQDRCALQSMGNSCFLSHASTDDGYIRVCSKTASENETVNLRTNREKEVIVDLTPEIDRKEAGVCELSYIKLYQHSKVKLNAEDCSVVKKARFEGSLHETLLDRREKMKSDKFCK